MEIPWRNGILAIVVHGDPCDELLIGLSNDLAKNLDRLVRALSRDELWIVFVLLQETRNGCNRLRAVQEPRSMQTAAIIEHLHAFGIECDAVVVEGKHLGRFGLVEDNLL